MPKIPSARRASSEGSRHGGRQPAVPRTRGLILSRALVSAHAGLVELLLWLALGVGTYAAWRVFGTLGLALAPPALILLMVILVAPSLQIGEMRRCMAEILLLVRVAADRRSAALQTTVRSETAHSTQPLPGTPEYIRQVGEGDSLPPPGPSQAE